MILYIARHGETDLNVEDRYQGVSDLGLNTRGMAQATSLSRSLPPGVSCVYTSPQLRARQTAAAIAESRRLPLIPMPQFRERDFGAFEGLTPAEAASRYPECWEQGAVRQWNGAPPGGETTRAVVRRANAGLRLLRNAHRDDAVVLVTHGFVVRAVRYLLTETRQEDFFVLPKIDNGEFLTLSLP